MSACHVEQAWLTQLKFLGSYTVPKIDVQIGASYQNIPGIELAANYADLNSDIAEIAAGRPAAGQSDQSATRRRPCRSSRRRREYYDRLNQLDLRLGKILRYGRTRANVSLDLYNLFNKGTITGASFAYANLAGAELGHRAAADEGVVDVRLLNAGHAVSVSAES